MRTRSGKRTRDDSDNEEAGKCTNVLVHSDPLDAGARKSQAQRRVVPPKKKAKMSVPSQEVRAHCLSEMPLDIMFEIFALLHPKDLVSLCMAGKALLSTLRSDYAQSIWIKAREATRAPAPPEDLTELQWAALIFKTSCMSCKGRDVKTIDFMLRRRLCTKCKKLHLIPTKMFPRVFPELDPSITSLVYSTSAIASRHPHHPKQLYFWKSDIKKMAAKLEGIEAEIKANSGSSTKKSLEDFKKSRRETVQKVFNRNFAFRLTYDRWVASEASLARKEARSAVDKRCQILVQRFIQLGHSPLDIDLDRLKRRSDVQKNVELTDKVWARLRQNIEPVLRDARERRLEEENKVVRS
ncbi:hypothetical protein D9619_000073 [Psilocybe cf. subviscida]|uniref:F-box domain-containing protein n=1 Tax=Psilocybe cf. subviscida TaxID=2480587 RepID=A0A8H5BGC5_9AGAR|nr:hypothetical protein D9619_000073 [Psilocybe cf. subviscida]